jgi:hypothetical protein
MPLHFSKSSKVVLDPNATNPDYEYDSRTGKYVLKAKTTPAFDPTSMYNLNKNTGAPPVVDQSERAKTEGDKPRTEAAAPYVNPQADRGNPPKTTAPVSGPGDLFDDTKTGAGKSLENTGVNKNTDTEPITTPNEAPVTTKTPVAVKTDSVVVDDDPLADPDTGRFAEGGQTDESYDAPRPNYNPQFAPTDTTVATTTPVVDDPPLSDEDKKIEDTREGNKPGEKPAETFEDKKAAAYNNFQQKITYAKSQGSSNLNDYPARYEIETSNFLSDNQKAALLAMYPVKETVETVTETPVFVGGPGDLGDDAATADPQTEEPKVEETVDAVETDEFEGMSDEEFNALPEEDQLAERIRRANKAGLPPKQEWLDRLAEITQSQTETAKTSLGTADLQNWSRRASAGNVSIEDIKALNLTTLQENSLINSYNTGVTKREADELARRNAEAEADKKAEDARIAQEQADERKREEEEQAKARDADEKRKVTETQQLVQGFKDSLLANPNFVINMDDLIRTNPSAASKLQYWMETSSEYAQAVRDADKPATVETGGPGDLGEDAEESEEEVEETTTSDTGGPGDLGADREEDTEELPEVEVPITDGPGDLGADREEEADREEDEAEVPITDGPGDLGADREEEESTEAFLSRMPAVPRDLNNIDALYWLADQEGVNEEDAKRWAEWATSTDRKPVERPTLYDDPQDAEEEVDLSEYASITSDLTPENVKILKDSNFSDEEIIKAGELAKGVDGIDAFNGYVEAVQNGTGSEWLDNYNTLLAARGEDTEDGEEEIDPLYQPGTDEYNAAIAAVDINDLILRIPEPPAGTNAMDKFFWLADQVDAEGNPLVSGTEAQAYYEWARKQEKEVEAGTSGGLGDESDPSNLQSIQTTIADEIEKVVKNMGFNSEEYKASQTTAIDARYEDARVRLGRQFAIDPGGTKTGRAQRAFETIENQRIQDLATLDTEVQDRLQAARDSTITNLVNAFSSITTGKMAEDQLSEQERQFNTELRESVRQFNNDISLRLKEFGLDETQVEAAIAKINSDMVNNTRAISAEISQAWADITGDVGVPGGVISLEDLGIPESEWGMFPYLPPSDEMKNTIKQSFEAMIGRSLTDSEMVNLMSNGRIRIEDNMPTQRAREFAATITQQNMDRISQYDAIAESNGLDRDKFTDAKDRADRDWARTNLEVAEEFGLDNNTFRNSMWDLDQRLSKIFFNEDYTENERDRQRRNAINDVARDYFPGEQGAFLQAKDQYDVLYGDRERAVATAFGMDAQTFARANKQADIQEERASAVWASAFNNASVRDYSKVDGGGKIDSTWLAESKRWSPDNSQFITFKNGIDDWADSVLPMQLATLNIKPPGDPSIGPGIYTPSSIVSELMQAASVEQKDQLYSIFQDFADGRLMNDNILEENLLSYITSAYTPDGDHKLSGAKASGDGQIQATKERPFFKLKAIDRTWFQSLSDTEQTAMMSLISGSNFSPDRSAGGTSALASIGRAFGIGAGAVIGGIAGGNPAASSSWSASRRSNCVFHNLNSQLYFLNSITKCYGEQYGIRTEVR